jgi:NTP pyrophosphatase (non-canonical NTP hydrolase)
MIDWATLIAERDEWVARNFPPYEGQIPGNDSILGVMEELGELAHAHLKAKQGIRGTQAEHDAAAKDAIGDITVYLLGVMSAHMDPKNIGLPRTAYTPDTAEQTLFRLGSWVGILSGFAEIPGQEFNNWNLTVNNILQYLEAYCTYRYWNYEDIVMDTWGHVKERDWNKHREDGAKKDDDAVKDPDPDGNDVGGAMRYLNSKD